MCDKGIGWIIELTLYNTGGLKWLTVANRQALEIWLFRYARSA